MTDVALPPDLAMRVRAVPENVPVVRHALRGMAASRGADARTHDAIALAVTEAAANVVVHAYRDAPGVLEVEATAQVDAIGVVVRDRGAGLRADARSDGLGAGLRIIGALAQAFDIRCTDGTTEVRMEFLLRRPQSLAVAA